MVTVYRQRANNTLSPFPYIQLLTRNSVGCSGEGGNEEKYNSRVIKILPTKNSH